jgi:hypothetical protein
LRADFLSSSIAPKQGESNPCEKAEDVERRKKGEAKKILASPLLLVTEKASRLLASGAYLIVAGATIDGTVVLWRERNLRFDPTFSANYAIHLARGTLTIAITVAMVGISPTSGVAAISAALWAAAGLIEQALLLIEVLLTSGEDEIVAAFTAIQGFVVVVQLENLLCDMSVILQVHILAADVSSCLSHLSARQSFAVPFKQVISRDTSG